MAIGNKVNLSRLSHVIYEHPDLEVFRSFARDFGLEEITDYIEKDTALFRGYGKDQYVYIARQAPKDEGKKFVGGAFVARSEQDFETACKMEGAKQVDISSRPGGGRMVVLRDPNDYEIRILYGQEEQTLPDKGISNVTGGRPVINGALDKHRKGS